MSEVAPPWGGGGPIRIGGSLVPEPSCPQPPLHHPFFILPPPTARIAPTHTHTPKVCAHTRLHTQTHTAHTQLPGSELLVVVVVVAAVAVLFFFFIFNF